MHANGAIDTSDPACDVTRPSIRRKSERGKTFQMSTVNSAQLRSVATRALCTCPAKSITHLLYRAFAQPENSRKPFNQAAVLCRVTPSCQASPDLSECDIYVRRYLGIPVSRMCESHWSRCGTCLGFGQYLVVGPLRTAWKVVTHQKSFAWPSSSVDCRCKLHYRLR